MSDQPETLDLTSHDAVDPPRQEVLRLFSDVRTEGGKYLNCLEAPLTLDLVRAMAGRKPERVVCLDAGFSDNDQLKANAVQIFRASGVTGFKTV